MRKLCFVFVSAALLMGCEKRVPPETLPDYSKILSAVFNKLPDISAEDEKYFREHPHERSFADGWIDRRWCVASQTAGVPKDFIRPRGDALQTSANGLAAWKTSRVRTTIPREILPGHLQWAGAFSICPTGLIRLGNPVISKETATVYFRVSGRNAMEGRYHLRKGAKGWAIAKSETWWLT